jgi:hypothetical protein
MYQCIFKGSSRIHQELMYFNTLCFLLQHKQHKQIGVSMQLQSCQVEDNFFNQALHIYTTIYGGKKIVSHLYLPVKPWANVDFFCYDSSKNTEH